MADKTSEKKAKVLIVDDHAIVRQGLAELINDQPDLITSGEAESPPEAIKAIAASMPDVAVVDVSLKGGDGIELCRQIHEQWPDIPILVLSMHDEALYAERVLRAGGGQCLRLAEHGQLPDVAAPTYHGCNGNQARHIVTLHGGQCGQCGAQPHAKHQHLAHAAGGLERLNGRMDGGHPARGHVRVELVTLGVATTRMVEPQARKAGGAGGCGNVPEASVSANLFEPEGVADQQPQTLTLGRSGWMQPPEQLGAFGAEIERPRPVPAHAATEIATGRSELRAKTNPFAGFAAGASIRRTAMRRCEAGAR